MRIKNLFLLACLLATTLLGANNTPIPTALPNTSTNEGAPCNLPAPFGFHVAAIGPTWVSLGWGGSVLHQHRIRIYRVSDNALLSTTIVPAGNLTATITIPFATECNAVINAICTDGTHSPYTTSKRFLGIILDLVVLGFEGSDQDGTCNITSNGTCTFGNGDHTTFKLTMNGQYAKQFDLEPGLDGNGNLKYFIRLPSSNSNDPNIFNFYCESSQPPDCQTPLITVKYNGNVVAQIDAYLGPTTNVLWASITNYGNDVCRIDRLGTGFAGDPPKGLSSGPLHERGEKSAASNLPATASPNPFSEALEVFLPSSAAEQVTLQLFNLSGQKVLDQQFTGGQAQYSLPTVGLSPGFYMLRIEADGELQTLKVVKSE